MNKKEKVFERNVCFTFFEDYRLTAKALESDFGKEGIADYYNAIIDYALYGKEPELKGAIKYVWYTTKTTIDKSIERRASGFSREDKEKTEKVLKYKAEHPEATQKDISEKTGVSVGKVNKVLKNNSSSNTDTATDSTSNSSGEREREHVTPSPLDAFFPKKEDVIPEEREKELSRTLEELTDEELQSLLNEYRNREKYSILYEKYNLSNGILDRNLDKNISGILKDRKESRDKQEKHKIILEQLTNDVQEKLCNLMGVKEEEIITYLEKANLLPENAIAFLEKHDIFTRKEWEETYQYEEKHYETYLDWFLMGVKCN